MLGDAIHTVVLFDPVGERRRPFGLLENAVNRRAGLVRGMHIWISDAIGFRYTILDLLRGRRHLPLSCSPHLASYHVLLFLSRELCRPPACDVRSMGMFCHPRLNLSSKLSNITPSFRPEDRYAPLQLIRSQMEVEDD